MFNLWIALRLRGGRLLVAGMTGVLCIFVPAVSYATSWPTFIPPGLTFLIDNNMINAASCPRGQAKITPNLKLNIQQHFCQRTCPAVWEWVLIDDQTCHALSDFDFQRYEFNYVRHGSDEDETLYTELTAYYGRVSSHQPTFKFTFTSEKDNHWQCSDMNPEIHSVICANDM